MSATKVSALDQLLLDIFTTALEGGINYWSSCQEYHWIKRDDCDNPLPNEPEDHKGFFARITESDNGLTHRITRTVVAEGYRLATTTFRDRIAWSSGEKPPLVVGPDTDWDFDADDADVIVQLGLFGEAVYG